jgi:hypothetical protein
MWPRQEGGYFDAVAKTFLRIAPAGKWTREGRLNAVCNLLILDDSPKINEVIRG